MATALLAQPVAATEPRVGEDYVDVAYEELARGEASAAIEHIQANPKVDADDPAALINLGTAYAMLGKKQEAQEYYRAAMASSERYELQLADGSWMDSRRLARMAAKALAKSETLAAR